MKPVWIAFLLLCTAAPVWGQTADKGEPSGKVQPRKARDAGKTAPDEKAQIHKKAAGSAPGAVPDEPEAKKAPSAPRKPFIDENGDGLNDAAVSGAKRAQRAPGGPNGRPMDRFTDPDGDGINDGRGFERTRNDRGKNALEQNLKGKNKLREKNGK